nr:lantibiotic dehydratase [Tunicatimonas sp. TK19036]
MPVPTSNLFQDGAWLQNPLLQEGLYIASHSLFRQYLHRLDQSLGMKEYHAILRYYLRMCTRSTPFGNFAGCGVTTWSDTVQIPLQQSKLHVRLDHGVVQQLAEQILKIPAVQQQVRYFPNNSAYRIQDEIRYVEYTFTNGERNYQLSSAKASSALLRVIHICHHGASLSDIGQVLMSDFGIGREEAQAYLQEVIKNQVLVSELEPAITGQAYLPRLLEILSDRLQSSTPDTDVVLSFLKKLTSCLEKINQRVCSLQEEGPSITALLYPFLPDVTEHRLFQVDTIFAGISNKRVSKRNSFPLNNKQSTSTGPGNSLRQLSEVLNVLTKLTSASPQPQLHRFSQEFYDQYGDREVPLSEALDTETGIDYLQQTPSTFSPLIDDLTSPRQPQEETISWHEHQTWKWALLQTALLQQQYSVEITDALVEQFSTSQNDLPPSMSVMFRKVEGDRLYLDQVGGVSAANLLNRFAYADPALHHIVQDICEKEQQNNPEVAIAEIVHLPESRTANILFHPVSRRYEIPYLAKASVAPESQLLISDLQISIQGGQIILRSQKLGKRIIPRLSTAHNYPLSGLPVYRFLCDLQTQGLRTHLNFHWGELANRFKFLPRVCYKYIILRPATWQLSTAEVVGLKAAKDQLSFQKAFESFQRQWRLPQCWVLADGDNELFVNSNQPATVLAWWDLIKNREQWTLKEYFQPMEGTVINEHGETHAHQLVATWIKSQPTYFDVTPPIRRHSIQRTFLPGSDWLYFQIYCSASTSDRILEEAIQPLVERLSKQQHIGQWFFIRYNDPGYHLRLRFHVLNTMSISEVMQQVQTTLSSYQESGMISAVKLDTYERELERYGGSAITEAEALFHYDSEAMLRFLSQTEGNERENLRWLWGLSSIDALLKDFQQGPQQKLALIQSLEDAFAQEFGIDKSLKRQIDKQYRTHCSLIGKMLTLTTLNQDAWSPLVEILQWRTARNKPVVNRLFDLQQSGKLSVPIPELLKSYIHMLVNRLIPDQQRFHELVLYDYLSRYYRSKISRKQRSHRQDALHDSHRMSIPHK